MKAHWFHFVFMNSIPAGGAAYSSRSFGFSDQKITCERMAYAKRKCGADPSSMMISCSYLVRMTPEEFNG